MHTIPFVKAWFLLGRLVTTWHQDENQNNCELHSLRWDDKKVARGWDETGALSGRQRWTHWRFRLRRRQYQVGAGACKSPWSLALLECLITGAPRPQAKHILNGHVSALMNSNVVNQTCTLSRNPLTFYRNLRDALLDGNDFKHKWPSWFCIQF